MGTTPSQVYRLEGVRLRAMAAVAEVDEVRRELLLIAQEYDVLAEYAEQREKSGGRNPVSSD
jgi:hypothetical protein